MAAVEDGQPRYERVMVSPKDSGRSLCRYRNMFVSASCGDANYAGVESDLGGALTQLNDRYLGQR